jgi:transposase/predicted nucleic acid-binding Zn finger protein
MSLREQKGRQIAEKSKITRKGNLWLVPSQAGRGLYKVDFERQQCSCPDFEIRRQPCKHVFAIQYAIEKTIITRTTVTENGKTTATEQVERRTYRQEWPAYNKAQMNEKRLFLYLLNKLCQGVGSPAQYGAGRRYLPLEDVIFALAFKVYSTVSGRRFMSDLNDAHAKGYISQVPSYNAMFDYFNTSMATDYLMMLIEESSLPLSAIEQDFAVDSTGLSGCRFVQWVEAKYGKDEKLIEQRDWIKMHLITGVRTNVVTAVEITEKYKHDAPYFKPLVQATARNFRMREVSADKAYLSRANMQAAADVRAVPYIAFKKDSGDEDKKQRQTPLWKQMWHYFSCHQERFMRSYHKRSNVETTFMMIKAKFGDSMRSKTERAQINEALCKVLCHNICCLIHAMYELGLKPKFYAEAA